ncbi:hypothetical protein [Kitasatospora herbaricolor]|uniref:hypothetical protein n=1 Tax=Kitasatospora herbaricolor TaxID=68217 RepID=UPI0036DBE7FF
MLAVPVLPSFEKTHLEVLRLVSADFTFRIVLLCDASQERLGLGFHQRVSRPGRVYHFPIERVLLDGLSPASSRRPSRRWQARMPAWVTA